jgi:hypothetical protein
MDVGCILILCGLGLTCCYFQRALGVDSGSRERDDGTNGNNGTDGNMAEVF